MKSVLIDNWTVERIIDNFSNNKNMISDDVKALLIALVLWEDVYYLDNEYSSWWKYIVDNMQEYSFLKQLKPLKYTSESVIFEAEFKYLEAYSMQYTSQVAQGALEYLYLANEKALSYLPLGKRARFIQENDLYKYFRIYYNRIDAIEKVDEDVLEYYEELNKMLRKAKLEFHPSCLYGYINKSADTVLDMFNCAMDLKSEKMVKDFRRWANDFENDIKAGKTIKIMQYKKDLEDLEKSYGKGIIDITLGIPAGVGISVSVPFNRINQPHLAFPLFLYRETIDKLF